MKLRLFHHHDGARVAYREAGTGPALVLLHDLGLSHRELVPVVEHLADRHRVVLPDLPLHGDSEDRPRHPYDPRWFAEVLAAFCTETAGARPLVGGHGLGATVLLEALGRELLDPCALVLLPCALHRPPGPQRWRLAARLAGLPGPDRVAGHVARRVVRPERVAPEAPDLVRAALADLPGNAGLARSWRRFARAWPRGARREVLELLPRITCPTLLLWADEDPRHPLQAAEEALDLLPAGVLRVLPRTGVLPAVEDPVGVAREIKAFSGRIRP